MRIAEIDSIEDYIIEQERLGTIDRIDLNTLTHVVNQALPQLKPYPRNIAVNVSPISINKQDFRHQALEIIKHKSEDLKLSIEITELSPISNIHTARGFVRALQSLGCTVGMDDVGSGHASTEIVEQLGLDYIKLSSKITEHVLRCEESRQSILEIVRYAADRDIPIVAEHIETTDQYQWLKSAGCKLGQGWLFAKPGLPFTESEPFYCDLGGQ